MGSASAAWRRLREFERLQSESLFSTALPHQLLVGSGGLTPPATILPAFETGPPSPHAPRIFSPTSRAELQPLVAPSSDKALNSQLPLGASPPGAWNFSGAWEMLVQAMSGNWCVHQAPHGGTEYEMGGSNQQAANIWLVKTSPATSVAGLRGGEKSPLAACRPLLLNSEAPRESWPPGQGQPHEAYGFGAGEPRALGPDQVVPPGEATKVLLRARCSVCSLKGNKSTSPNQDRAVCARLPGGGAAGAFAPELLGVMDGHGEVGHLVADVCCDALPKLVLRALARSGAMAMVSTPQTRFSGSPMAGGLAQNPQEAAAGGTAELWREAMVQAFEEMHLQLEALTTQFLSGDTSSSLESPGTSNGIDSRTSGTTATVALVLPGARLLVAHVGDSRAVLGVRPRGAEGSPWRVVELTRDHKPDLPDERARIEATGAQVVTVGVAPNTTQRVFTPHQTWPSINMSRSLGDLHAHSQGLSAEAEVRWFERAWDPRVEDAILVMGSDGIWDVIDGNTAVDISAQSVQRGADAATALAGEAYERWARRGFQGAYSDDITVVVRFL